MEDRLIDEYEAASKLHVSVGTLRVWRATGNKNAPPYIKVGGAVRYSIIQLGLYLDSRTFGSKGE